MGRTYNDLEGFKYIQGLGGQSPFSKKDNQFLFQTALSDIRRYPKAYLQKVLFNLKIALSYGVYVGEYVTTYTTLMIYNPGIFISLIWLFILITVNQLSRRDVSKAVMFGWIILLFSLGMVSFLQYINRHLNAAYAILVLNIVPSMCDIKFPRSTQYE